jgi:hypothetical protein
MQVQKKLDNPETQWKSSLAGTPYVVFVPLLSNS